MIIENNNDLRTQEIGELINLLEIEYYKSSKSNQE